MLARIAGTVILATIVFIVVSLLVSLGVLWWIGDVTRGALIGVMCGTVAAFTVSAVSTAIGRVVTIPPRPTGPASGAG
jgi:hypothetical protein